MKVRRWFSGAALLLGVVAIEGCGGGGSSTAPIGGESMSPSMSMTPSASSRGSASSASPPATAIVVRIRDFSYTTPASVRPGSKVTVMNADSVAHTLTSDQGSLFNVNVAPGQSATLLAPSTPGAYGFHCIYHGNMHGTLVVK